MLKHLKQSQTYLAFRQTKNFRFLQRLKDSERGVYQRVIHYIWHKKKKRILDDYRRKFSLKILIETGTWKGDMIAEFADKRNSFKSIYSIELSPYFYNKALKRFSGYANVFLSYGDSAKLLEGILSKIDEPCLFWLDAHYMKGETSKGNLNTPIVEELNSIFSHKIKNHIIIIDDAKYFNGTGDYPDLDWLREYILQACPKASFMVKNGVIRIVL